MIDKIKCKVISDNGYKIELIRPRLSDMYHVGSEVTLIIEKQGDPIDTYDTLEVKKRDVPEVPEPALKPGKNDFKRAVR
jgi:hypothetical protein